MSPEYIDKLYKRARFEAYNLGMGDVMVRFAIILRDEVLETAARCCEEGNLATNYSCAEAIRELKETK